MKFCSSSSYPLAGSSRYWCSDGKKGFVRKHWGGDGLDSAPIYSSIAENKGWRTRGIRFFMENLNISWRRWWDEEQDMTTASISIFWPYLQNKYLLLMRIDIVTLRFLCQMTVTRLKWRLGFGCPPSAHRATLRLNRTSARITINQLSTIPEDAPAPWKEKRYTYNKDPTKLIVV